MKLTIKSILAIRTFTTEKGLEIPLKQGEYSYYVKGELLYLISDKEPFDIDSVTWELIGDGEHYSTGSDAMIVSIQDRKNHFDDKLDVEEILDNIDVLEIFSECAVFHIPSGEGGGLNVYTTKNEKGHILGIRLG